MAFPIMFSITCTSLSCYTLFALSCLTDWIFDSSRWPFKFSDISVVFVINAWILTGYARTFTRINQSNFYELLHFVIRISLQKLCRHYQPCHRVKLLKILYYQKYQQRNYQVSGTVSKISGYMTVLFRACLQFPLSAHTIRPLADTDTVHCKVFYLLTYLLTYLSLPSANYDNAKAYSRLGLLGIILKTSSCWKHDHQWQCHQVGFVGVNG